MLNFVAKEPVNKGWSSDQKFCVTGKDGTRYLLRLSSPDQWETKKTEFQMMQQVAALGIPMCRPADFRKRFY